MTIALLPLLSHWAGPGHEWMAPAGLPRLYVARDGRRAVAIGGRESMHAGDRVRVQTGRFVALGRQFGAARDVQLWEVSP